ncbi:integrase family protein, partial [Acinetobacter baumannii]|nr:integrase [Acinetobacter baumannii]
MSTSRVKLTKSFIDQLELTPAIYRDSEIIGFAIRVNNSYKTTLWKRK